MDTDILEGVLEEDDIMDHIDIVSSLSVILHILIKNKLTTEEEFINLRTTYIEVIKRQIRNNILKEIGKGNEE